MRYTILFLNICLILITFVKLSLVDRFLKLSLVDRFLKLSLSNSILPLTLTMFMFTAL